MTKDFNSLPTLTDFSGLKFGDKVYSRRFGHGVFLRLHGNEAIVEFSDRKVRIAPDDSDVSLVSKKTRKTGRNVMSGEINGEKVSFRKLKQAMTQTIVDDFVSVTIASDILGKNRKQFISLCDKYDIEITKFGIKKEDLLKLNRIVFSK